ncbi:MULTISPECIES: hypothetical protein [unclassified Plantactinospora]|uniref:hypothetical protein n=1 Tax=unclassified Plantactinospora TaxID=2631981 RepID=UPI00131F3BE5|nr:MULTISPECIES: hypothetical protein [unclassified Plantactinospora]
MTQFTVDPEALHQFATGATDRATALDDVRRKLHDVRGDAAYPRAHSGESLVV